MFWTQAGNYPNAFLFAGANIVHTLTGGRCSSRAGVKYCWIFMSGAQYRQTGKKRLLLSTFISLWSPSFSFLSYSLQLSASGFPKLFYLTPGIYLSLVSLFSLCLTSNIYLSIGLPPLVFTLTPCIYLPLVSLFIFCLTSNIFLSMVSLL